MMEPVMAKMMAPGMPLKMGMAAFFRMCLRKISPSVKPPDRANFT